MIGRITRRLPAAALALVLLGSGAPGPASAAAARGEDSILAEVLERVQAAREEKGAAPLLRRAELDEVALARARDIAARPPSKRLSKERSIYRFIEDQGLGRPYRAREQIDLQVDAPRPAEGIVERWGKLSEAWSFVLDAESDSIGLGAVRSSDGWLVFVAVLVQEEAAAADLEALEQAVFEGVNQERAREGLAPLVPLPSLVRLARGHSRDMAARAYFSHDTPEGLSSSMRAQRAEIEYRRFAENISRSWGVQDPVHTAVHGWMTSPGHRKSILNPHYIETGVGIALGEDGFLYFTQVFRQPLVVPEPIAPFPRPAEVESE